MYLNCHTVFSFKYGTLTIKSLYEQAKRCGVKKIVLTEINNVASYIEMLRICQSNKSPDLSTSIPDYCLEIALGVEFRNEDELCYIIIARNNNGFENINRFLSFHNKQKTNFPPRAPQIDDIYIVYPFEKFEPTILKKNEFIGIKPSELNRYALYKPKYPLIDKFLALYPVTFSSKKDFNVHRLLRAMAKNTLLSKLTESQQARADEIMVPAQKLEDLYNNFPELIKNSNRIIDNCQIDFDLKENKNKRNIIGNDKTDWEFLVSNAWKGFQSRYNSEDPILLERFNRELSLIKQKNFYSYFLIAYKLIQFSDERGYDHIARGSGSNSLVAFCLGITDVDPIELDLYFERFLNTERTSPPDFDIDFSWENRDEIYNYFFSTYGIDHVCLLGTHVTYQKRSVIRELSKVFGLPKEEIDSLIENPIQNKEMGDTAKLIFKYAEYIKDLPSNISIHAGGVLITERPIYTYTATEYPPKGLPVSHFDMINAEDMGIHKFDILSQRGLGHLKEAVNQIKRNQKIDVDINRFQDFKKDKKIVELLRNGRTMGCFYVESPSMRMLLGKLSCEDYLTLVAASSIIRPGVAQSGMMRIFIERFHQVKAGKKYEAIHPDIDLLLKDTYGVMVYQEDVIKVAHYFAGMTLAQSDVLRRGMSGKYRSREEFQLIKNQFFNNCMAKGYEKSLVDRIWFEIESFAGYSFAKGHSASYALESYQSLFLKAHYPLEFMVGVINNFGGFYKTEFYFHEAKMAGATILPPCVNQSQYLTTIVGKNIFMGFVHIKHLEQKIAKSIVKERDKRGKFTNLENFLRRLPNIKIEQIRILIKVGAFDFTKISKKNLLWFSLLFFSKAKINLSSNIGLFDAEPVETKLPNFVNDPLEDAFDQLELLGFTVGNPFQLLNTNDYGDSTSLVLKEKLNRNIRIVGYMVTIKYLKTKHKQPMHFGTFNDWQGHVFDTIHFPNSAKKFPFRGWGFYEIFGKVVEDFGVYMIDVSKMVKLPLKQKKLL